ncbi:dihydrolipoyllysine-residue acetyltransferase component of pyruvate dehydrogenase complex, aceF [Deinococcus aerius]|uniref:Acetyltransferase component of pyruvate dehydrogenase complex n=1 Tax=Deinococcus aerius TaxID=200253 RepID=A0A2I9CXZ0_9DEIO|nr:dihydrolipoyllysine-residue acetyltransferase [Deinococcus aerius]GBF06982.1 dihydrolipoyllysine-residue acetyltransferase component of pyruvate dehydrogenase complex, aceF [Deinococcus aerius]
MATELKLPDVGDNIEQGTVVTVLVGPGDSVTEGQPIIEIETDKAVVEVPATQGGTVEAVSVNVGDTVPVGGTILTLAGGDGGAATASGGQAQTPSPGMPSAEPDSPTVADDPDTANRVAQAQVEAQKVQAGTSDGSGAAPARTGPSAGGAQVTLPDVGDNIEQGTVVTVLVGPGDTIQEGQPVIEIETDKAVVEVPANASGTVQDVAVKVGDTVKVGGVILTLGGGQQPAASAQPAPAPQPQPAQAPASRDNFPVDTLSTGRPTAPRETQLTPQEAQPATQAPGAQRPYNTQAYDNRLLIPAAPSVRRLARELHVDIHDVHGTGIAGRISEEDVRRTAGTPSVQAPAAQPAPAAAPAPTPAPAAAPLPNFERWGTVRREDMSGIRKATVRSMTQSWTTIPMVTHFDKADVTRMEETRRQFGARVEKAGGKLTMTHILMKVVANALRKYPKFGASLDLEAQQVVYKDYVNLGVAVDTPQGLLVPVLKDADRKSITEIVLELNELAGKARERKLKPDEMQGATFTISNLGGIGGYGFTPIVNAPEVAILGVSRGGFEPVWNKETGSFEPRNMLPLSLTYDHRLIDGADAARFLRYICEALEDPFLISL